MRTKLPVTLPLGLLSMAAVPVQSVAAEPIPQITAWALADNTEQIGLWLLPRSEGGEMTRLFTAAAGYGTYCNGIFYRDHYFTTRVNTDYGSTLVYNDVYDPATGTKLRTKYPDLTTLPYDMAVNPLDGKVYGFFSNSSNTGMVFGTVDYDASLSDSYSSTPTVTPIREMEGNWIALACNADGAMYAISSEVTVDNRVPTVHSSALYSIDASTGETTYIGETGQKPLLTGSATIDPRSGRMFWSVAPDASQSYLCEVDLTTGEAVKLFSFPDARIVMGMYVDTPAAEDQAPDKAQALQVVMNGGSLDGTMSFTAPALTFAGQTLAGTLDWQSYIDGVAAYGGQVEPGQTATTAVTFESTGQHTVTVFLSNSAGRSPKAEASVFAGFGTPVAPEEVTATLDGGVVTLTWAPVTTAADGGYLNPADIRYTITDNTGCVLATGLQQTEWQYTFAPQQLTAVTFRVQADNGGLLSTPASSSTVVGGTAAVPYSDDFTDPSTASFYTVVDANGDGITWEHYRDYTGASSMRVKYNSSADMDDWLLSPPVSLEEGKTYRVRVKVYCENDSYPEKAELKYGTSPTAEGMMWEIAGPTVIDKERAEAMEMSGDIVALATGTHYIGLHGISPADMYYLDVMEFAVDAGVGADAPAGASDLTAVPDPSGDCRATVSWRNPDVCVSGEPLAFISKVTVTVDGETAVTLTDALPGEQMSCTVELGTVGLHTVGVSVWGQGVSQPVYAQVTAGIPVPGIPANVRAVETSPGNVTLSWDAVDRSETGAEINPDRVRYNIYTLQRELFETIRHTVAEGVEGTSFSHTAVAGGDQQFIEYAVEAVTDLGAGECAGVPVMAVGTSYKGFAESYAGGEAKTIWRSENINYGNWKTSQDSDEYVTAQDGDNGYMMMAAYQPGYAGAMYTGKVSLADCSNPGLSFHTYRVAASGAALDLNQLTVSASTDGCEWTELIDGTMAELCNETGWNEIRLPLTQFAGQDVQLRFYGCVQASKYMYLDNLNVIEMPAVDLGVNAVSAPAYVNAGETFTVSVSVYNHGACAADWVEAVLLADGNEVGRQQTYSVEPGAAVVAMEARMHPLADAPVEYTVMVSAADDTEGGRSKEATFTVTPLANYYPVPANLEGLKDDTGKVEFKWEAPVLDGAGSVSVNEGFESAAAWADACNGWVFVDVDGQGVTNFIQQPIPGIETGITRRAFFVFSNAGEYAGNPTLEAAGGIGHQWLAALARYDDLDADDWAVSPLLSGNAQTVSFDCRSYTGQYPEKCEVYYSLGSADPAEFILLETVAETVPEEWTNYEVALPEGAKRFAIRSCAKGGFVFFLDNVCYEKASEAELQLQGYNIYRNRIQINGSLLPQTCFTDCEGDPANDVWQVTAVYDLGESAGSHPAVISNSGMEQLLSGVQVNGGKGFVAVTGAQGLTVTVVSADGRALYCGQGDCYVPVAAGVYAVRVGDSDFKVMVK